MVTLLVVVVFEDKLRFFCLFILSFCVLQYFALFIYISTSLLLLLSLSLSLLFSFLSRST